jgi:hypothetical protein
VEETQIRQGVEAMVEINVRLKKGYRIVQWRDTFEHQSEQSTEGVQ